MEKTKGTTAVDKKTRRQLILKALTDPKFRKQLDSDPLAALGRKRLSDVQRKEIAMILATVKGIESQVNIMADNLLCACSVSCSVAA